MFQRLQQGRSFYIATKLLSHRIAERFFPKRKVKIGDTGKRKFSNLATVGPSHEFSVCIYRAESVSIHRCVALVMTRRSNVFHRLVTDEDSTTELLCNLMQFPAFSRPLLARFLSQEVASQIGPDDIETQKSLAAYGRADIVIDSAGVYIVIEVKVDLGCGLTPNQPESYFSHLLEKGSERECWLVFLLPRDWALRSVLREKLEVLKNAHRTTTIRTAVFDWDDILEVIEQNGLDHLNPFFDDFHKLLDSWFRPRPIHFSYKEVNMLYSKDVPKALMELGALVDEIQQKGSRSGYKVTPSKTKAFPSEYGLGFHNAKGEFILWFGVWPDFWREEGIPLCFGVDAKWVPDPTEAFRHAYKGTIKQFQDGRWTLGYISKDALLGEGAVEEVWKQLEPVLDALSKAAIR